MEPKAHLVCDRCDTPARHIMVNDEIPRIVCPVCNDQMEVVSKQ